MSGRWLGKHQAQIAYMAGARIGGGMSDAGKLVAWLREAADEIEGAHAILDENEVPRDNPATGAPFTLAARIAYMAGVR